MKITAYNRDHNVDLSGSVGVTSITYATTHTALGSNTPKIESGAGSPGSGPQAAAWDHVHPAYASGSNSGVPWFTVTATAYGAVGNGTTDDTAAINLAIAALNTAGKGVLYFPAGTYKVTSALTTITANGTVMGDGMGAYDSNTKASAINCTSQTAVLFTVTADQLVFRDLGLYNTYAGTASAGCAIKVNGTHIGQKVDLDSVVVSHFYDNIVRDVGSQWVNHNVWNWGPVRYGETIQNTVNQDAGDWSIVGCNYYANTNNGTAAIYQTGAGGGKITGTKINGNGGATYTTGINVAIPTGRASSILAISACSIENVSGDGVLITTTGTGQFGLVTIAGLQVGLFSNNTGRAVKITAASAGGTVAGGIYGGVIDGCAFRTDGTARAAVQLTNTDAVALGDMSLVGFNARYTSSGDTNTVDGSGVSYATPAIVLGTAAAAGAASTVIRSDATIVAFDATAPVTQAFGDVAATGSAAVAARRDHVHGMPASAQSHILLADGHATPFTFNDLLQMDDGSDFMWSD